jgi:hypothetical protein
MSKIIEFRKKGIEQTKDSRLDGLAAYVEDIVKQYGADNGIMILRDEDGEIRIGAAGMKNEEIPQILLETLFCFQKCEKEKERQQTTP